MHAPYYILTRAAPNAALVHPTVQYHYADDSPLAVVPHPSENVLVLDFDPSGNTPPTVQSISPSVAVTNMRLEEAPGAAASAAEDGDTFRNDRMFIIETTAAQERPMDASMGERKPPTAVLAQFKQRNAVLRRALLYPTEPPTSPLTRE